MKCRVVLFILVGLAAALAVVSSITGLTQIGSPDGGSSVTFTFSELGQLMLQTVLSEGDKEKMIDEEVSQNLWNSSKLIPTWMKEYFTWHTELRVQLNESNWKEYRYLVMRCLHVDGKCGGASDRIKSIPALIRLAAQTNRIILIRWERPAKLEAFLVPPKGGVDWRVPEWMDLKMGKTPDLPTMTNNTLKACYGPQPVFSTRFQFNGSSYYDAMRLEGEASFVEVYHDCWLVLFEPSKPVANLIAKQQEELGLFPNRYAAVHIRALYERNRANNLRMVENAINCASQLQPSSPIFVASDSVNVTKYAVEYGRRVRGQIIIRRGDSNPLHLDRGASFLPATPSEWVDVPEPSAYYDSFVDLYLLAGGRCTTYGLGGYGPWANIISSDVNCAKIHIFENCAWMGGNLEGP